MNDANSFPVGPEGEAMADRQRKFFESLRPITMGDLVRLAKNVEFPPADDEDQYA